MKIAIVNPIMQTRNYPAEKDQKKAIETDKYCNIIELADAISRQGNKVTVFASDAFKPKKTISGKNKMLEIEYLPTRMQGIFPPAILPYCPNLAERLNSTRFDAIIATEHYQLSTMQAAFSKQKKTKLLVWQELDREFAPFLPKTIQKAYNKTLFRIVEKKIDLFMPRSSSAKNFLEKICASAKKISPTVPTPVNTKMFKPKNAPKNGFVLDVTRLNKDRNLGFLLDAAEITKKTVPDIVFVVAGDGPEKKRFVQEIKKRRLEKNILVKTAQKKEMPLLYSHSALAIIHSTGGLFPFTALEAMACGKPVISSFRGALLDLIQDGKNGFFVDSPQAMAKKIVFILKERKKCASLGKNARQTIIEKFSMEKVAEAFAKKISGIL